VVIAARTLADLETTSAAVEGSTGRRYLVVQTDIKDEQQVIRLQRTSVDELDGRNPRGPMRCSLLGRQSGAAMFTTVTAAEWGRHGIRVNCLVVGGIASPRAEAAWRAGGIDAATIGAAVPIGGPAPPRR
jgi:hypothetical protein